MSCPVFSVNDKKFAAGKKVCYRDCMTEMIDRIAKILRGPGAMCRMGELEARETAVEILEEMRKPTLAMCEAGKHRCHGVGLDGGSVVCAGYLSESPREQWERMIDQALE